MRSRQKKTDPNHIYQQLIMIVVILVSAFTYAVWTMPPEIIQKMGSYVQVLTLSIFAITCYIGVNSYLASVEDRSRSQDLQYCNLSQSKVADVDRVFMGNPLLDRLYFEMYSIDPHIKKIVKMRGKITPTADMLKYEHQACNLIIQKLADIYACERFLKPDRDSIEWINTFRCWMKSPILRSHWEFFQYECHPELRTFVKEVLIDQNKFLNPTKLNPKLNSELKLKNPPPKPKSKKLVRNSPRSLNL